LDVSSGCGVRNSFQAMLLPGMPSSNYLIIQSASVSNRLSWQLAPYWETVGTYHNCKRSKIQIALKIYLHRHTRLGCVTLFTMPYFPIPGVGSWAVFPVSAGIGGVGLGGNTSNYTGGHHLVTMSEVTHSRHPNFYITDGSIIFLVGHIFVIRMFY
jgi:hypothetical protein